MFGLKILKKNTENRDFFVMKTSQSDKNSDTAIKFLSSVLPSSGKSSVNKIKDAKTFSYRTTFDNLEAAYLISGLSQRCVNYYVSKIGEATYELVPAENGKKAVKIVESFLEKCKFDEKREMLIRDACICGNGWWELIENEKTGRLVNIERINFKIMDFIRDSNGFVETEESGEIRGYMFGKEPFKTNLILTTKEFVGDEKKRIFHFTWNPIGTELAIGCIEPVYTDIKSKHNLLSALNQTGWRVGFPLYGIKIGDAPDRSKGYRGHNPTPAAVSEIETEFGDINEKRILLHPYWTEIVELSKGTDISEHITPLKYFDNNIVAGMGLPLSIGLGEGGKNTAGIDVPITRDLLPVIMNKQQRFANNMREIIFKRLMRENGISEESAPHIRFDDVIPEDLNKKSKRFVQYIDAGVLVPKDIREMVLKEEGLPVTKLPKIVTHNPKNI